MTAKLNPYFDLTKLQEIDPERARARGVALMRKVDSKFRGHTPCEVQIAVAELAAKWIVGFDIEGDADLARREILDKLTRLIWCFVLERLEDPARGAEH
jgi:hypothetical protein